MKHPPRSPQGSPRAGKSLIELIVVIGLLGTLLTATSTTLHQVIRAEIAARHASDRLSALSRAALAFRTDVHAARQLTIGDEGKLFTCQLTNGGQATYVVGPQSVTRVQTATGQSPRRETFRLLGGTARFQQTDRNGLAVYTLVWQLPTTAVTPGLASDVMSVPMEAVPRLMIVGR